MSREHFKAIKNPDYRQDQSPTSSLFRFKNWAMRNHAESAETARSQVKDHAIRWIHLCVSLCRYRLFSGGTGRWIFRYRFNCWALQPCLSCLNLKVSSLIIGMRNQGEA